jgi:hypothetical protein
MSSIIHAERPQNFLARRRAGWLRFSGTSLGPWLARRVSISALARPASRLEPRLFSASEAVFAGARVTSFSTSVAMRPPRAMSSDGKSFVARPGSGLLHAFRQVHYLSRSTTCTSSPRNHARGSIPAWRSQSR